MFVATTTEKSFSGASHITTYHIVFEPAVRQRVSARPTAFHDDPTAGIVAAGGRRVEFNECFGFQEAACLTALHLENGKAGKVVE